MISEIQVIDTPHILGLIKSPKFRYRIYSPTEIKYLMEKHFPAYIMAEMYAAKLAYKKCMGINFMGCKFNEISILRDYSGSYYISLCGETKRKLDDRNKRINISCSHTKIITISCVTIN